MGELAFAMPLPLSYALTHLRLPTAQSESLFCLLSSDFWHFHTILTGETPCALVRTNSFPRRGAPHGDAPRELAGARDVRPSDGRLNI
jgi:hypothetical protein